MKAVTALILSASLFTLTAHAHPGRTASDGCHYCRTNCASWGVQAGVRHCHGGGLRPDSQIEIMEKSSSAKKGSEVIEVTHTHGDEGKHSHKSEMYN